MKKFLIIGMILTAIGILVYPAAADAYQYHNRFQYVPGNHGGVYTHGLYNSVSPYEHHRVFKPTRYETFPGSDYLKRYPFGYHYNFPRYNYYTPQYGSYSAPFATRSRYLYGYGYRNGYYRY